MPGFFTHNDQVFLRARATGRGMALLPEILKFIFMAWVFLFMDYPVFYVAIGAFPELFTSTLSVLCLMYYSRLFMLLVVMLLVFLGERRGPASMGFLTGRGVPGTILLGLLAGLALMGGGVLAGTAAGIFRYEGISSQAEPLPLVLLLLGFLIQGFSEEVLCRGYFMISVGRKNPVWIAVLLSALGFSGLHFMNDGLNPVAFLNLFLFGLFSAMFMMKTGNIWSVGVLHGVWNFAEGNFFGFPVSGFGQLPSLYLFQGTDNVLFDGGEFGPEGGLLMTVVLLLGIWILLALDQFETDNAPDPARSWHLVRWHRRSRTEPAEEQA